MGNKKRKFGDRKDGRQLRSLNPITTVGAYIMVDRNDACNLFEDRFDVDTASEYIKEKRKSGLKKFGYMHLLLAGYVRTVSQRPGINRFISGQKIYARDEIVVNMAVKKELSLNAEETMIKIIFKPSDGVEEVYNKCNEAIDSAFGDTESDFDGTAKIISFIPGLVKKFAVWLLKTIDYFGWLPKSLLNVSPFHGSLVITSMASLGIPPIYHHLYNFGNVPVFIAFGTKETENVLNKKGEVETHTYLPYKVTCDERICDGQYYASAFKYMRRHLKNPYLLDEPIEKVIEDID